MKLFRKKDEVKNNSIIKRKVEKHSSNLCDVPVSSSKELCTSIVTRTISNIDDALRFLDYIDYQITTNCEKKTIEIYVNSFKSSDNFYYSKEDIQVPIECDLINVQERIIQEINVHYYSQKKIVKQKYVTTYTISNP